MRFLVVAALITITLCINLLAGNVVARWEDESLTGTPLLQIDGHLARSPEEADLYLGALGDGIDWSPAAPHPDDEWWDDRFYAPWIRGFVRTVTEYNGDLIIGGSIHSADNVQISRVVAWDGSSWDPLGGGVTIWCEAALEYNGDLVVGGLVTSDLSPESATEVAGIGRWDGSSWGGMGGGTDGSVYDLVIHKGDLIVGGSFAHVAGDAIPAKGIGRWDGTSWHSMGELPYLVGSDFGVVYALVVWDTLLVAGGRFAEADGVPANNLAYWNGANWVPVPLGTDDGVDDLAVFGDQLIVAGEFLNAGGSPANRIVAWDGSDWWNFAEGCDRRVKSLTVHQGKLIASGDFATAGGVAASRIAAWDGFSWDGLGSGLSRGGHVVKSLDSILVAGGSRYFLGESVSNYLSVWLGSEWEPLHPYSGGLGVANPSYVSRLYDADSMLLACGSFYTAAGKAIHGVAAYRNDDWEPLGTGAGPGSIGVGHGFAQYDDDIYMYGYLVEVDGVQANNIARYDGMTWSPVGGGSNASINDALVANDLLYVIGSFDTIDGIPAGKIATWDGFAWDSIPSLSGGYAYAMTEYLGDIVVGGSFTTAGGLPSGQLARWDGSSWHSMAEFSGALSTVLIADLESDDSLLYVSGDFSSVGGLPAYRIAVYDGAEWHSMGEGLTGSIDSAYCSPSCLHMYGNELVVGGDFTGPGNRVARWNGAEWKPLGSGLDASVPYVSDLGVYENVLFVGGYQVTAGGKVSSGIAAWAPDVDYDGVLDVIDVCPTVYNPDQEDLDGDGLGDACHVPNYLSPLVVRVLNAEGNIEPHPFDLMVEDPDGLAIGVNTAGDTINTIGPSAAYFDVNGEDSVVIQNVKIGTYTVSILKDEGGIPGCCAVIDFTMGGAPTEIIEDDIAWSAPTDSTVVGTIEQPPYMWGDIDATGVIDISDLVYLVSYMYQGGPIPIPYEAGDIDCSGEIDISDLVRLVEYMYQGGANPGCF